MAKMAAAGANANKMVGTLDGILHGWTTEGVPPSEVRERVQQVQDDIEAGVQAAEDYVGEADTDKGRTAAQGQLEALTAVQSRLVAVSALMT